MTKKQETSSHAKSHTSGVTVLPVRVYYADTDAGGIVYHANYLRFAEMGRTEWMREVGVEHGELLNEHNLLLAIKLASIDFQAPARLDDLLHIETCLTALGGASMDMHQVIRRNEKVLVTVNIKIVAITPEGAVTRIPDPVRQIMKKWLTIPTKE